MLNKFGIISDTSGDEETKIFMSHLYSGPGCVIPVSCIIRNCQQIIKELICIEASEYPNNFISRASNLLYTANDAGDIEINFKILFKEPGTKKIKLQFFGGDSRNYTQVFEIQIVDMRDIQPKIYKIVNNTDGVSIGNECFTTINTNTSENFIDNLWIIPGWTPNEEKNVYFYNFVVLEEELSDDDMYGDDFNYELYTTKTSDDITTYAYVADTPFVSRTIDNCIINRWILRYDKISGEEITGNTLEDYSLDLNDILYIIIPDTLKYNKDISNIKWEFINMSTLESKTYIPSTWGSFISLSNNLTKGYYSINLYWAVSDTTYTLSMNSVFRLGY